MLSINAEAITRAHVAQGLQSQWPDDEVVWFPYV